jgi:ABC-type multidrug transport system ATPase subunit
VLFGFENDFLFTQVPLLRKMLDLIFGYLAPFLISLGMTSIVPLLISQPIVDRTGEIRSYMVSCTLSIFCYWLAQFVIDVVIWIVTVTIVWVCYIAARIQSFEDNIVSVWYSFVAGGPAVILSAYCLSFLFHSPDTAARQAFLVLTIALFIPVIIDVIRQADTPGWLEWLFAMFPALHLQRLLNCILVNIGIFKQSLGFYWTHKNAQPHLVMELLGAPLYGAVLWLIEHVRVIRARRAARRQFEGHAEFFTEAKTKHPVTQEAKDMEAEVHTNHDYAVRIENCSRLLFNTAGDPIPAVNDVSLGVKEGSLFGFLGANGAGKTTLIKMITSMLPLSSGTIEIMGADITNFNDPTRLSICPQFNTHLCEELTPREHLQIYSLLFQMPPEEATEKIERLVTTLDLEPIQDKPVRELSGGDVRKLTIALSFLGPAKIVLLDEPTASLDPVARHHVHEMITDLKNEKTFMLCTHLLSEAETLCDMISIMIKGCVYTVGSPAYLSGKFGTEYKVDVMLVDDTPETVTRCDQFFRDNLPSATLSIARPRARIYTVPAADISLPPLFMIMAEGKEKVDLFTYYTCSSSSLERVFMEIVRMSECDDVVYQVP